jgi:hypothetical protein
MENERLIKDPWMENERLIKDLWATGGNGPSMPEDKPRSQNLVNEKTEPAYDQRILHQYGKAPEPCKLKLIKMAKSYGWEISGAGDDFEKILKQIIPIDEILKAKYGNQEV